MTQYVKARFEAPIPPWVTPGALATALQGVLDAARTTFDKALKSRVLERTASHVFFDFAGLVTDKFDEHFDRSCDELAMLASDAFETELESDTNENDINGAVFRRVLGPNDQCVGRYKLQVAMRQVESAASDLLAGPPVHAGISEKDLISAQHIKTFTCAVVDERGMATPVLSVNTRGLDAEPRRQVILQSMLAFRVMASAHKGLPMVVELLSGGPMSQFELSPPEKARASLGLGGWKQVQKAPTITLDGCLEFSFVDENAGKDAYVIVEQGRVVSCEITDIQDTAVRRESFRAA